MAYPTDDYGSLVEDSQGESRSQTRISFVFFFEKSRTIFSALPQWKKGYVGKLPQWTESLFFMWPCRKTALLGENEEGVVVKAGWSTAWKTAFHASI